MDYYESDAELRGVIDSIAGGEFSDGDAELFKPIVESLLHHDEYLLLADYASYIDCCERAARAYSDEERWTRMSILNVARCGFFSSDRTIQQYCDEIWHVKPVPVN
jgi:starch phosphorylase